MCTSEEMMIMNRAQNAQVSSQHTAQMRDKPRALDKAGKTTTLCCLATKAADC